MSLLDRPVSPPPLIPLQQQHQGAVIVVPTLSTQRFVHTLVLESLVALSKMNPRKLLERPVLFSTKKQESWVGRSLTRMSSRNTLVLQKLRFDSVANRSSSSFHV